jgi:hypothetical protein
MSLSLQYLLAMNCFSIPLNAGGDLHEVPVNGKLEGKTVTFQSTDSSNTFDAKIIVTFGEHGLQGQYTLTVKGNSESIPFTGALRVFEQSKPGVVKCSLQQTVDVRYAFFSQQDKNK